MGKIIESDRTPVLRPVGKLFDFLSDFRNFSYLMPEQVENWQATADDCTFEIRGLGSMGMRMIDRQPDLLIVMKSEGKLPFDFILSSHIVYLGENSSEIRLVMDANLNPFLEMMAKGPLQNFVNILAAKLKEVSENSPNF